MKVSIVITVLNEEYDFITQYEEAGKYRNNFV